MLRYNPRGKTIMIITKAHKIEGKEIIEDKGVVFGEVVAAVNYVKDFAAGYSNFLGGKLIPYEEELIKARENALKELEDKAKKIGANAILGLDVDYEVLGPSNNKFVVTTSGTAAIIR